MTFGEEVKKLRGELKEPLTQKQLADRIGVNQSFVAKLESGVATRLGADVLYRLCDALEKPCDHFRPFLTDPPSPPPTPKPDAPKLPRRKGKG